VTGEGGLHSGHEDIKLYLKYLILSATYPWYVFVLIASN